MSLRAQTITPAELQPGVTIERIARAERADAPSAAGKLVRGKAAIFWDPKVPRKKLDAIDTDQLTPSSDCVSESLETFRRPAGAGSLRRHAVRRRR